MDRARDVLKQIFGYDNFRPLQDEVISTLIGGGDVLTIMPTGGGKSLCYQIPSLVRSGTGIVVSPLIALMQDQVDALTELGVKASFLNSSQTRDEQRAVEAALLDGTLDLLYISPERLTTNRMMELLASADLALFAIDEAHCVSQWGHDFRPEYRRLSQLSEYFPHVPRIGLTATADERTREEIVTELRLNSAEQFIASFDRPNLCYTIQEGGAPREALWQFISDSHPTDSGIVYCLSRRKVEDVAEWLSAKGRVALPYHAGLDAETRRQAQARFLREDGIIMVATVAFGMGIDKPDVRFVAHLNLPKSIESYYQETGRAGRDGLPANTWMAYGLNDVITYQQWIENSEAGAAQKQVERQKLDALLGLCEHSECRRQSLLTYFNEPYDKKCGNCDNCLSPPETMDGLELAQKALSTVYRTGQRFGVAYMVKILRGAVDDRIVSNGHDQVSTFGIGKSLDGKGWRSVFRQLIARGFLIADPEQHGGLRLSESCRPLLKGETPFHLRLLKRSKSSRGKGAKSAGSKSLNHVLAVDNDLWEALIALRVELATKQNVPPYVICHNRTLEELVLNRPQSLDALEDISGLATRKIARYGEAFLKVIAAHPADPVLQNKLTDTVNQSLRLYLSGMDAGAIADERGITISTVYDHFAEAIEAGVLDISALPELDAASISEITGIFEELNIYETGRLKPGYDALEGRYNYGILKCVLADRLISA
ncbi:MAG: ATP-dependent DNA helicase RecQ [Rhodomicrobium sp.]|nr:MAG: ATP-dependent DNA helicase RecQ [Rhodomicrobium sp.]